MTYSKSKVMRQPKRLTLSAITERGWLIFVV